MPKNIVLCFDGTSDEVNSNPSNVLRLFRTLQYGPEQLVFYEPGIGTLMDPEQLTWAGRRARKGLDLAAAFGLQDKVVRALTFISLNYESNDKLYLFGFSRGSYTARAVAGALKMFGLLRPEHAHLYSYVWQRFSDNEAAKGTLQSEQLFETADMFKEYFAEAPPIIHFVGCFDTVSSVGFMGMYRTLPYTRTNDWIRNFRHATAIDEKRAHFPLNVASPANPAKQDYKAVWFAGCHSDVGGGQPESEAALAKVPLDWMLCEAERKGLLVDPTRRAKVLTNPEPNVLYPKTESLEWYWKLIGILPMRTWSATMHRFAWHWPNFAWIRPIDEGALIHESVIAKMKGDPKYKPKNLPKVYTVERCGTDGAPQARPELVEGASSA